MERLVQIERVTLSPTTRIEAVVGDGLTYGDHVTYDAPWEPTSPSTIHLMETLTGKEAEGLRAWRSEQGLGALEAISTLSVGVFYRVTIDGTGRIVEWLERFGTSDPHLADIRAEMQRYGLDAPSMWALCKEEFGVTRYEHLSLTDREQLVALFNEPDAAEWISATLTSVAEQRLPVGQDSAAED